MSVEQLVVVYSKHSAAAARTLKSKRREQPTSSLSMASAGASDILVEGPRLVGDDPIVGDGDEPAMPRAVRPRRGKELVPTAYSQGGLGGQAPPYNVEDVHLHDHLSGTPLVPRLGEGPLWSRGERRPGGSGPSGSRGRSSAFVKQVQKIIFPN